MWPPSARIWRLSSSAKLRGGAAQRRSRRRQGKGGKGKRDAGTQPVLAVRHFARHRPEVADLDGQRFQEGAIEGKLGTLQHDGGMLQPGDDALGRRSGLPGDTGNVVAMHGDPVGHQRTRIGGGKLGTGGAHVAQPAEAVQRLLPAMIGHIDLERRLAAGFDQMSRQGIAAVIDLKRDLWVGEAQVRWRDQDTFGRAAGIAPAIDRPGTQAPARLAPELLRDKRPKTRRVAGNECQKPS